MEENFGALMVRSIASLALVLAIFAGLIWGLKRLQYQRMPISKSGGLRVVQRLSLDAHHSVVEVVRDNRHYILGLSDANMCVIEKLDLEEAEPVKEHRDA